MALGATIDFEAGNVKRAPEIFQKLALEWLYRFLKDPKRLFKRYFVDDMQFFYYFTKQLLGSIQKSVRQIDFFVCETVYRLMLLEIL